MLVCVQHTAYSQKKTSVQNFLSGVFFSREPALRYYSSLSRSASLRGLTVG